MPAVRRIAYFGACDGSFVHRRKYAGVSRYASMHGWEIVPVSTLGLPCADISGERQSANGRADAILKDKTGVYVFEFKYGRSAKEALDQARRSDSASRRRISPLTATSASCRSTLRASGGAFSGRSCTRAGRTARPPTSGGAPSTRRASAARRSPPTRWSGSSGCSARTGRGRRSPRRSR